MTPVITREEAAAALAGIRDPHLPVSLADMGMLADVRTDGTRVRVALAIPCLACPAVAVLTDLIRERLLATGEVTAVEVTAGWHVPWDREAVPDHARSAMRAYGIQI